MYMHTFSTVPKHSIVQRLLHYYMFRFCFVSYQRVLDLCHHSTLFTTALVMLHCHEPMYIFHGISGFVSLDGKGTET